MNCQDILVVVENSIAIGRQVVPAAALAARCGARLTGIFPSGYPIGASYGDVTGWMQLIEAYLEAQRSEAAAAEAAFRQELANRKLAGDWIYREADETAGVVAQAMLYDLVVIGQPDPDAPMTGSLGLRPEEIVLGCGRQGAYLSAAISAELDRIRTAVEGTRNHTLYKAAAALGQLVAGGCLTEQDVTEHLTHAALAAGLTPRETARTIASGLRAGSHHPRTPTTGA